MTTLPRCDNGIAAPWRSSTASRFERECTDMHELHGARIHQVCAAAEEHLAKRASVSGQFEQLESNSRIPSISGLRDDIREFAETVWRIDITSVALCDITMGSPITLLQRLRRTLPLQSSGQHTTLMQDDAEQHMLSLQQREVQMQFELERMKYETGDVRRNTSATGACGKRSQRRSAATPDEGLMQQWIRGLAELRGPDHDEVPRRGSALYQGWLPNHCPWQGGRPSGAASSSPTRKGGGHDPPHAFPAPFHFEHRHSALRVNVAGFLGCARRLFPAGDRDGISRNDLPIHSWTLLDHNHCTRGLVPQSTHISTGQGLAGVGTSTSFEWRRRQCTSYPSLT